MKLGHAKKLSPGKSSSSRRHQECHDYLQKADKANSNVAKKQAIRQATSGDIARPFAKGHIPYPMDTLMDSLPSYLPNTIMHQLAECTQGGTKFAPCAMSGTLASAELCFTAKSLARNEQHQISFLEAEVGKNILKCGLQSMSDNAIEKATSAKQATREISWLQVMLTALEIEEAECHTELLHELHHSNMKGYLDANQEAFWFERFLSDRTLVDVKDDFDFNWTVAYPNDLASLATADKQLNQLNSHAEEHGLISSKKELAMELKALIVEGALTIRMHPVTVTKLHIYPELNQPQYPNTADFNASSSVDPTASFGVVVPYMQPYCDSPTAPDPCFTQAALESNLVAHNQNTVPFNSSNPYFTSPTPNFPTLNPNFAWFNTSDFPPPNFAPFNAGNFSPHSANFSVHHPNFAMPNPPPINFTLSNPDFTLPSPNFAPPNLDFTVPNIAAPHPHHLPNITDCYSSLVSILAEPLRLVFVVFEAEPLINSQADRLCLFTVAGDATPVHNTDLQSMMESYQTAPSFGRHRIAKACASAHTQPYNQSECPGPLPILQAQQVGFKGDVVRGMSWPSITAGPPMAVGPLMHSDDGSKSELDMPLNTTTSRQIRHLKRMICD
ncbi:hypothetical protein BDR07DRAFT_1487686 [Suillus spraguei]|nr:hypothetical protein BDR07DRAFT_1487686 [Suillus spraguei]